MTDARPPVDRFASPGLRKAIIRVLGISDNTILDAEAHSANSKLIAALARTGGLDERAIIGQIAQDLNITLIDLQSAKAFDELRRAGLWAKVEGDLLLSIRCVPIRRRDESVLVAFADPLDLEAIARLEYSLGSKVSVAIALEEQILGTLDRLVGYRAVDATESDRATGTGEDGDIDLIAGSLLTGKSEIEGSETAPVITFVNQVLSDANDAKASDIHFEPSQTTLEVRYRIDGVMLHQLKIPKRLQPYVTARLKIMSGMDITEKRRPQDGRFRMRTRAGSGVDVRSSTVPTAFGEKVVLRLLRSDIAELTIESLKMPEEMLSQLKAALQWRDRMFVVSGPTGSGKTTTLYSALNSVRGTDTNIITVEDPVEIRLEGISQIQVDPKVGMTFASGLRSILRQDPDIILVGEIRDLETAETALQAAQTGHLVLSTVHTNSAPATIIRLIDLGAQPFVIASSLGGVLAQRLVRKICSQCCEEDRDEALRTRLERLGIAPDLGRRGAGCEACEQSGYRGRMGVYSIMLIDSDLRDLIRARAGEDELRAAARRGGMRDLHEDGLRLVAEGQTTLNEVERVIGLPRDALLGPNTGQVNRGNSPRANRTRLSASPAAQPPPVRVSTGAPGAGESTIATARSSIESLAARYRATAPPGDTARVLKILFVDDDEGVRAVIGRVLRRAEFEVCEASNGFDALEKLGTFTPDLILCDLVMPGMDGRELVQELRKEPSTEHIPIIVLTGSDDEQNEIELIDLGATDFVSKGSSPALLLARVRRFLPHTEEG